MNKISRAINGHDFFLLFRGFNCPNFAIAKHRPHDPGAWPTTFLPLTANWDSGTTSRLACLAFPHFAGQHRSALPSTTQFPQANWPVIPCATRNPPCLSQFHRRLLKWRRFPALLRRRSSANYRSLMDTDVAHVDSPFEKRTFHLCCEDHFRIRCAKPGNQLGSVPCTQHTAAAKQIICDTTRN